MRKVLLNLAVVSAFSVAAAMAQAPPAGAGRQGGAAAGSGTPTIGRGAPINNMGERAKAGVQPSLTVPLWPGVAPGSETWTHKEEETYTPAETTVQNVVKPELLVYLPQKSKATGTGVIIAPGGAFRLLAIDVEGKVVAQWLVDHGIAAFVLKYRTTPQLGGATAAAAPPAAGRAGAAGAAQGGRGGQGGGAAGLGDMDAASKLPIVDGVQAIKVVRQHAAEWGVAPDKIGIVGFSAGAMLVTGVALESDPALRPNFAAPIYGGPWGVMPAIPASLPPMFLAWAQDDTLAGPVEAKFYDALKAAGHKPEVHIYAKGGHGFGMRTMGNTTDHWIDEFYYWMQAQGFAKRPE
jgi:acetyl esterase/lipase